MTVKYVLIVGSIRNRRNSNLVDISLSHFNFDNVLSKYMANLAASHSTRRHMRKLCIGHVSGHRGIVVTYSVRRL